MIRYIVESLGYEFHAYREDTPGTTATDDDPATALRLLVQREHDAAKATP